MEFLKVILENSHYSIITAMILGLMTAISPCPLATNISAIGFISQEIGDRRRVFVKGLIYTLGRAISYTGLALIIYFGANQLNVSRLFQGWGEKLLSPLLIIIGLIMLDLIKIKFPGFSGLTEKVGNEGKGSLKGTFLLGMVFALAFCPYSGVIYFAMLLPLAIADASGLFLPAVFAVATGLPVIIFAWLIAYAVGSIGKIYGRIKIFEFWFRHVVAIILIGTGIYNLIRQFI